jgi:hypothetical protein
MKQHNSINFDERILRALFDLRRMYSLDKRSQQSTRVRGPTSNPAQPPDRASGS